jgi:hypothetical protein
MDDPRGSASRTSQTPGIDELRRRVISDLVDIELRAAQPAPRRPWMGRLRGRLRGAQPA